MPIVSPDSLSFSGFACTFKLRQSHKTLIYPSDEVLISEENLELESAMCELEDNVSLWNAFILYEAYYASKTPKPNKSCPNVMDFKSGSVNFMTAC